ncbi:hypothetical protein LCGC14_2843980 [marine sediment metagenome]|uniref:Uncharacterized protein n=1 Tax=marine sediment metagenome TaxID=412755 RepID=A0A0F8YX47_9ZZZZ
MTKRPKYLDVHVWSQELQDNPAEELEATYRDTYAEPNDPNSYHQYGVTRSNGEYLEIRIPIDTE